MNGSGQKNFFRYDDNVAIHFQLRGRGKTPVVFVHGFAAALITWHDIAPLFPEERFRLFLIDLKGFGLSAKPRDGAYTIADQTAIVKAFIEAQGLSGVVLVGHSLGGTIALLTSLSFLEEGKRDAIGKLILIDCAAYPRRLPPLVRLLRTPLLGPLLLRLVPVRLIVRYNLDRVFHRREAVTPERIDRYVGCFRKGMAYSLTEGARQLDPAAYAHIAGRYRKLPLPTLIIWGKEDRVIPYREGVRLQGDIPSSILKIIEGCGHNPHEEMPEETFAAIDAFLREYGKMEGAPVLDTDD